MPKPKKQPAAKRESKAVKAPSEAARSEHSTRARARAAAPRRPKEYTTKDRHAVLDLLAGGKSLRAIARLKGMPSASTVHAWLNEDPEYARAYRIACDVRADALADIALGIALGTTAATAIASRVKIDTLKWFCGATSPRRWGPQSRVGLGGIDDDGQIGLAPPTVNVSFVASGHRVGIDSPPPARKDGGGDR